MKHTVNELIRIFLSGVITVGTAVFTALTATTGTIATLISTTIRVTNIRANDNTAALVITDATGAVASTGPITGVTLNITNIRANDGTASIVLTDATGAIALTKAITISDAIDIIVNAGTGTKIGTATSQKIGFWNAAPVVQQAAVADAAGGATVDAEARTAINALLARLRTEGLIAT